MKKKKKKERKQSVLDAKQRMESFVHQDVWGHQWQDPSHSCWSPSDEKALWEKIGNQHSAKDDIFY